MTLLIPGKGRLTVPVQVYNNHLILGLNLLGCSSVVWSPELTWTKYMQNLQGLVVGMVSVLLQRQIHCNIRNEHWHTAHAFLEKLIGLICLSLDRSWHAWGGKWRDDKEWIYSSLQYMGYFQGLIGSISYLMLFFLLEAYLWPSVCLHTSAIIGSPSPWLWCEERNKRDNGHHCQ